MLLISGIGLLLMTLYEIFVAETDTYFLCEYLWFDVSRWKHPITYWFIIACQTVGGCALIWSGLTET